MQRRLVGIAVAAFALTVLVLGAGGFGTSDPSSRDLDALGVLLAAGSTLPLVAMRVAPGAVFAVVALADLVLLDLWYPLDMPFGLIIAAYALAEDRGGEPRRWRRGLAMAAVGAFTPIAAVLYARRGFDPWELAPELLFLVAVLAGAWIAGDRGRLRQERMAALAEQAVRTEREAERERGLAVAQERTRIARELHDSAGHAINVILVQAGAARLLHETNPEGSREAIATIEDVARATIDEIDQLVRLLREDDAAELSAPADPAAVDDLLARHRAGGLKITAKIHGPRGPVPPSVAWAAYRILQEALTNAARHGRGSAEVALSYEPAAVEITVTNPTGSGAGPVTGGGHGIVGMRERASLLGGSLDTRAGQGTFRLAARLPHAAATSS
jgi:signal transduction histidine kinase